YKLKSSLMGIKNLPWKKIGGIVFIIAAIITIATNLSFVWNCVKFLGNLVVKIFTPLANSVVRDVLLFVLIVGILIWLIMIGREIRKLRKLQAAFDELKRSVTERKKKEESVKLTEEHINILGEIANSPRSLGQNDLFESYKKNYPNHYLLDMKSTISDLMQMDYIYRAGAVGGELLYKATDKGVKLIRKLLEAGRKKKKSSENK
ncbi:MAG: hypothetical protein ACFFDN_42645, partial [Candidatus Hodarchaeota archaeon]